MEPTQGAGMPAEIEELHAQSDSGRGREAFPRRRTGSTGEVTELDVDSLLRRIDALEREKASLEGFAAVAAHEILQPLILAEAYTSLIADRLRGHEHAESRRDLEALTRGVRRGRALVETLLYDARTAGEELERAPVDLNRVVDDCLEMLGPDLTLIDVEVEVTPLPEVCGNEALISGLYKNLLLNAVKYAPRTGSAILVGAEQDGDEVCLFVQSDGPTLPEEERERIFEPFVRGQGDRRARGSGLGLAICRTIVERHGGHIAVAAGIPAGNRFSFTLPG
jgi:signal transduction histidine kinase